MISAHCNAWLTFFGVLTRGGHTTSDLTIGLSHKLLIFIASRTTKRTMGLTPTASRLRSHGQEFLQCRRGNSSDGLSRFFAPVSRFKRLSTMIETNLAQPDLTLLLDMDGIIRDASGASSLMGEKLDSWLGKPWSETVTDEGGDAVERMISDARAGGVSGFRQIVQRFPSGRALPFEYTTLVLGGRAGLMAIGKNLQAVTDLEARLVAAQQAMERDYWKLREVETRYRQLFEASTEAVLLLRETNLRIVEANPAAIAAMGLSTQDPGSVVGREFLSDLSAQGRTAFIELLAAAREHGKSPGIVVQLGPGRKSWLVRASLMISEPGPVILLQLTPALQPSNAAGHVTAVATEALIERSPDGFVVVDRDGVICRSNESFLDMIELGSRDAALGKRIGQWLSKPGADWPVLCETVVRHKKVRRFATLLHGQLGTEREVEISAVGNVDDGPMHIGLVIRDLGSSRTQHPASLIGALDIESGVELLEGSSLKALVDSTVENFEKHYLSSALRATSGNKRAAADLLGLSRQSLYAKLNRYGLIEGRADTPELDEIE